MNNSPKLKVGDTFVYTEEMNRAKFINFINNQAYEDGSNCLSYAELFYGEDNGEAEITSHN